MERAADSEGYALDSIDGVEMAVVAQHRQNVLAGQCGDPDVIRRYRRPQPFQFQPNIGKGIRCRRGNVAISVSGK